MSGHLEQFVPLNFQRRGVQRVAVTQAPKYDVTLITALGRALWWQSLIESGHYRSVTELALDEGLSKGTISVVLKLAMLAPDLIKDILAGYQPRRLTLLWLQRNALPTAWSEQRELFARFREVGVRD